MAVTDSLAGALAYARERPAVAVGVVAAVGIGGALALWRSRQAASDSGAGNPIYGVVGDSSKFPPDGYPGAIVNKPVTAPAPAPIPAPGGSTKPPVKVDDKTSKPGKPGDRLSQAGKPYYCPAGSFLTWERGNTGNQVCQKEKGGTQFAVKYRK